MQSNICTEAKRAVVLKIFKFAPKQISLLGTLCTYLYRRHKRALRMQKQFPEYVEPIPLTKIYNQFRCNARDKQVVKAACHVFFVQRFRGNNLTGRCSGWIPRTTLHVNQQVLLMIHELYRENIEHVKDVRAFINAPQDHRVELTTTFQFSTKEQAEAFAALIGAAMEAKLDD